MKINKTLLAGLLMMVLSSSAIAQENGEKVENVFNPHWYVQAQPLGMQYTLGENPFGKLLSYNLQVAGGYNFNKYLGARFAINAYQSKAGWDIRDINKTWKWYYIAPAADVTLNLSNLMFGYDPDRLFTFGAFAGIGVNIFWGNNQATDVKKELTSIYDHSQNLRHLWDGCKASLLGRAGVTGDFRINSNWSVGIELQATTVGDKYNSKKAGNTDWYFNGLIGVKYVFGKSNKKTVVAAVTQTAPAANEQVKMVEKVVEKTVYVETTIHEINRSIYFRKAGNTAISSSEMNKVKEVADFLKDHPEATVTLCGYADKGTGTPAINAKLSEKRAKAVADALINKYGIAEFRITIDHKGDTEQPKEGSDNRVTIAVAKSKKVVEVVK